MVPPRAIILLFLLLTWELSQKLGRRLRGAPRTVRCCVPQTNLLNSCEPILVVVAVAVRVAVIFIFIFIFNIIIFILVVVGSVSSDYGCGSRSRSGSRSGGSSSSNRPGTRNGNGNDTVAHHLGAISSILWQAAVKWLQKDEIKRL